MNTNRVKEQVSTVIGPNSWSPGLLLSQLDAVLGNEHTSRGRSVRAKRSVGDGISFGFLLLLNSHGVRVATSLTGSVVWNRTAEKKLSSAMEHIRRNRQRLQSRPGLTVRRGNLLLAGLMRCFPAST